MSQKEKTIRQKIHFFAYIHLFRKKKRYQFPPWIFSIRRGNLHARTNKILDGIPYSIITSLTIQNTKGVIKKESQTSTV